MQSVVQGMLQELEHEAASTRKMLERVPDDKLDYKPHPRSFSLRQLASHLADALDWGISTMTVDSLEMDFEQWKPFSAADRKELLAKWDAGVAELVGVMKAASDEKLFVNWTMKDTKSGKTFISMPRIAVMRAFILSHMIHHRGQLSVYLRMLDVPLPQVYGPTADETDPMGA